MGTQKYCRAIRRAKCRSFVVDFFSSSSFLLTKCTMQQSMFVTFYTHTQTHQHTNSSNCRQIFSINREICGNKSISLWFSLGKIYVFYIEDLQKKKRNTLKKGVKVKWKNSCSPYTQIYSFSFALFFVRLFVI